MSRPTNPAPGPAGPAVVVPLSGRYRIDTARSKVTLRVKHMFGLGTVHATVDVVEGELVVAEPVSVSTVRATVDTRSFSSGSRLRDKHVAGQSLLDSATYPEASFTSRAVRQDGGQWLVDGEMRAHGTAHDATLRIDRAESTGDEVRMHAATRLDRTDLGITKKKGMVGRTVDVEFDLVATHSAS